MTFSLPQNFVASTQFAPDEDNLLIVERWTESKVPSLFSVDLQGNETQFSDQTLGYWPTHISPDHSRFSARDEQGNLIIIDANGDVISEHMFSSNADEQDTWYIWGWKNTNTVIASQKLDGFFHFYELDVSMETATSRPATTLNDFFIWDIDLLQNLFITKYRRFIFFSHDFSAVSIPELPEKPNPELSEVQDILTFWNLDEDKGYRLTDSPSFWFVAPPAWANQRNTIAFSYGQDIYTYDLDSPDKISRLVDCSGYCITGSYSWSPTDHLLAYWEDDQFKSYLKIVDVVTGNQSTVFSGDFLFTLIFWSPDEEYLAVLDTDREYRDTDPSKLLIIDVGQGKPVLSMQMPRETRLVGWLHSSAP